MEFLTILAALGNVLQFTQLGIKLIRKTIEYSNDGGSTEHQALRDFTQRLMDSNAHLQQSLQQDVNSAHKPSQGDTSKCTVPSGPELALRHANEECLKVSKQLFDLLDRLKLNGHGSIWRNARLALTSIRKSRDLERLQDKVREARSHLVLSLLVCLESRATNHHKAPEAHEQRIREEIQKIMSATPEIFKSAVEILTTRLSTMRLDEQSVVDECKMFLKENQGTLTDQGERFDGVLRHLNVQVSALSSQFDRLKLAVDRDLLCRRRILQSLYFAKMDERRNRVHRPHGNTYQWIFKPKSETWLGNFVWDGFLEWLSSQEGPSCYWVTGKPGSGKTTLMRELDERLTVEISSQLGDSSQRDPFQTALQQWTGDRELLKACGYFWYAGTAEQKSFDGLLRSLVRQLLMKRPDLIDKVVNVERWENASISELQQQPWDEGELIKVLEDIIAQTIHDQSILLFIDGLDEFDGPDERRDELINFIERITQSPHVKACVASRRWNIFIDAFQHCATLSLENLTKEDIRKFVHEKFEENKLFCGLQRREPGTFQKLATEIINKARGVFLWVSLAVRDLLKVLRDGGHGTDLFRELEQIPSDLDEYFERMLRTIELSHRKEAAMMLQVALCRMDYNEALMILGKEVSAPDLYLWHFEYLKAAADRCFAAKDHVYEIEQYLQDGDTDFIHDSLNRRLNSRCMGLLETETSSKDSQARSGNFWSEKVELLHRTVQDFLLRPPAQRLLAEYKEEPFDAHLFRCNLLVVNVATSVFKGKGLERIHSMLCFLMNIIARTESDGASFLLFDKLAGLIEKQAPDIQKLQETNEGIIRTLSFAETILNGDQDCDTAMSLAIKLKWMPYIQSKLTRETIKEKKGRPLLDYALHPRYCLIELPCPAVVQKLLELGADPCELMGTKKKFPVWSAFFISMGLCELHGHEQFINIVLMLLRQCNLSRISLNDVSAILSDFKENPKRALFIP